MFTHWSASVPIASHNPMNGGTEEREQINGRERNKRDKEWKNWKDHGGFRDGWDCCLLEIIVSR